MGSGASGPSGSRAEPRPFLPYWAEPRSHPSASTIGPQGGRPKESVALYTLLMYLFRAYWSEKLDYAMFQVQMRPPHQNRPHSARIMRLALALLLPLVLAD